MDKFQANNSNGKAKAILEAPDSPMRAFYRIWVDELPLFGLAMVTKESGGLGKVFDRRTWSFESFEDALEFFKRRVRDKTNPERRSPRIYRCVGK